MALADRFIAADDGCELWASFLGDVRGTGEPLILCHGGPGLWDMFGPLADELAAHVPVIRWDQRGCGRSARRGPYSMARSVADLDALRRWSGADRVALLGHSFGATLALRYALDHPERVSALAYVSGTGLGWAWHEEFQQRAADRLGPVAPRMAELRSRDRDAAEDRELAILSWSAEFTGGDAMRNAEAMATPWFGINHDCHDAIWTELKQSWSEPALVPRCKELEVPVLIIDGATDLRPRWAVDSLAQALPVVTRVIFPAAGHLPWVDAPAEFRDTLLGFLGARD